MPTVPLTGDLGLDANVTLAPFSSLLKYFQQLPALRLSNGDFSKAAGLTLDQPALTAVSSGISFDKAVASGPDGSTLSISAGLHGSLALFQRTPALTALPDVIADDIEIVDGTCYVAFGIDASVGASGSGAAGQIQFGISPGAGAAIHNYQSFPLKHDVTLLSAVEETIGKFIIPGSAQDLASLPDGRVATVTGSGSLRFSGQANLLAVTNPLATAELPGPLPAISVNAGGTITVGAAVELSCTFQISARKLPTGHIELGWYRDKSTDFSVKAAASEGISAGVGTTDLLSTLIGAISSSAAADLDELQKAGLSTTQVAAIQGAVAAAVNRKLELAVSAEIGATDLRAALFLYDIDLTALSADSRQAIDNALRGDLSGLHASPLPGISAVQSVWEKAKSGRTRFEVNLLGILNFGSLSSLTVAGSVMVEPATGALVISDSASAERIRSTAVNFGADTQKLRHVMSESFLITATYQGVQGQVGGPTLTCSHDFFDLSNSTGLDRMTRDLRIGTALGVFSAADTTPPPGMTDFGRTVVHATAAYDKTVTQSLFLDASGAAIPQESYESAGRAAIRLLVAATDDDAVRRKPATNDALWSNMKALGQPGFPSLFPGTPTPFVGAITADYTAIMWWAEAMAGASRRLAAIAKWFGAHTSADQHDPQFEKLRQDLAAHLKQVVATTSEEFGEPWGLIAMDQASGRRASASVLIASSQLVRMKQRTLAAAASSPNPTE
jgi:hypothetical protein